MPRLWYDPRWGMGISAVLLTALIGCQAPVAGPPPTAASAASETRLSVGAPDTWAVTNLDELESRRVLAVSERTPNVRSVSRAEWMAGDRYHTGAASPYWKGGPLGYGYTSGGLLPFYAGSYLDTYGTGFFAADPIAKTVYQVAALDGVPIADASVSVGGRFISFVTAGGELGIFDSQTQLIQTFPQLNQYAFYGYGGGYRGRYGVLQVGVPAVPYYQSFGVDAYGNLAYLDLGGRVRLFDPRTQQEYISPTATRGLLSVDSLSLSPNGRFVITSGLDGGGYNVYVNDIFSGRQYTVPFVGTDLAGFISSAQLNATGNELVFSQNGRLRVLNLGTGFIENLPLVDNGVAPVFDAGFLDPLGENVIYSRLGQIQSYNRRTHLVDTMPILNQHRAVFGDPGLFNFGPVF